MPDWYGEYDDPLDRIGRRPYSHSEGDDVFFIIIMAIAFAISIVGTFYPEVFYPWNVMWKQIWALHRCLASDAGGMLLLAVFYATLIGPFLLYSLFLVLPIIVAVTVVRCFLACLSWVADKLKSKPEMKE